MVPAALAPHIHQLLAQISFHFPSVNTASQLCLTIGMSALKRPDISLTYRECASLAGLRLTHVVYDVHPPMAWIN